MRSGVVAILLTASSFAARAQEPDFVVREIRLEGLERISEGTVYNYLPINIGDRLDRRRIAEAIRALYGTKFFKDVELRREDETLVVAVLERPTISSFEVKGNKEIKTEELEKSLRNVGLAQGKSFDRSTLDDVQRSLTEQYFSHGKYSVRIDTGVQELPGNLVKVSIRVREGKRARIGAITIVGNRAIGTDELRGQLELRTPNLLSWYAQDDRYSKEALSADIEKLRSYYMDRGFADFQILSNQVAVSPEKDRIFITVNVQEGDVYRLTDVKFAGNLLLPESDLRQFLSIGSGELYSQRLVARSTAAIERRLGLDGYAFAKVDAVPHLDRETHTMSLSLVVDPGHRVYVRRVNFSGTTSVNDDVLRREMRQLEGAYLSNAAIERSKIRLQRLPYLQDVDIKTQPVPGSNDLVDVDVSLKDGLPGQFGGGIGYSQAQSLILNASIIHANVLGTGERLALEVNGGRYSKVYDISTTNPYATVNGLSRTLSLAYHDVSQLTSTYSAFSTKTLIGGVEFSYPVTELAAVQFGASLQHAELATPASSSKQLTDWIRNNGTSFFEEVGTDTVRGTRFDVAELSLGWSWDSRDRTLFPTHGAAHRLSVIAGAPISTNPVEYLLATYDYQQYFRLSAMPLLKYVPFSLRTSLNYGTGLGGTTDVPPNRHFFTGGSNSVRGFRDYTLGPRDSLGNPYGGDASLSGQFEAILPTPQKFANSARATLFVDFGDSFFLGDTKFVDKAGYKTSYPFDLRELRVSTGVGVEWLSPLGLFRLSWAYPLRYQRGTERRYGDEIEPIQFTFGKAF